jgi:hypothetical protein
VRLINTKGYGFKVAVLGSDPPFLFKFVGIPQGLTPFLMREIKITRFDAVEIYVSIGMKRKRWLSEIAPQSRWIQFLSWA